MSDQEEPRWDCLPHDPQTFFGLADGFDRKDLKRSYNKLLRRFKPERHPDEFQRIRAAYEMLDGSLRYGRAPSSRQPISFDWKASETVAEAAQSSFDQTQDAPPAKTDAETTPQKALSSKPLTLDERLRNEPAEAIYAELAERQHKTPFEFYALAVLSDLVVQDDRFMFLKWLLAGMKEHADEPGLFSLVLEYFKGSVPEEVVSRLLVVVSNIVTGDRFYYLTERLWDRLLAGQPFETFDATLQQCEANLGDHRIEGKIAFYIHILRRGLWKAPDEWLDQVIELINENYEHISDQLEYDLELSLQLNEYRRQHRQFLNGAAIRSMMHDAIVAFCEQGDLEAERRFIECQSRICSDLGSLFDAFPIYDSSCHDSVVAWHWVSNDIQDRIDIVEVPPPWETFRNSVFGLMQDLDDREDDTFWGFFILAWRGMHILATVLCCLWPYLFLSWLVPQDGLWVFLPLTLGLGSILFYWLWARPRTVSAWFDRLRERIVTKKYNAHWRDAIVRILNATHASFNHLSDTIQELTEQHHPQLNISTWLVIFIRRDYGLLVYSLALRFQR
jgi:hypothetical protein